MAGVPDRHVRGAALLCLGNPERHRLLTDPLAEAVAAVHYGHGARLDHHGERLAFDDPALAQARDVAGYTDDAVAVVAREVGTHEMPADGGGLGFGASLGD